MTVIWCPPLLQGKRRSKPCSARPGYKHLLYPRCSTRRRGRSYRRRTSQTGLQEGAAAVRPMYQVVPNPLLNLNPNKCAVTCLQNRDGSGSLIMPPRDSVLRILDDCGLASLEPAARADLLEIIDDRANTAST